MLFLPFLCLQDCGSSYGLGDIRKGVFLCNSIITGPHAESIAVSNLRRMPLPKPTPPMDHENDPLVQT
ncbi:hypothetical protein SODG_006265 [Sodalis praecaptivus]